MSGDPAVNTQHAERNLQRQSCSAPCGVRSTHANDVVPKPGACIIEADDRQSDDNFHSPTVIPPSALDKPSIMKLTIVGE